MKKYKSVYSTVASSLLGNSLEFYDFVIYSFLLTHISKNFIPSSNILPPAVASLLIFSLGYLSRPFASLLFGYIGDTLGRKTSLKYSILLTTVATATIGLTPSYESIGVCSTIILIICRILQGISISGEEGGAVVFLSENFNRQRGLIGSLIQSSVFIGLLLGSCCCLLTTHFMEAEKFAAWGWRIPFITSIPIGLVSFLLRLYALDSTEFLNLKKTNMILINPLSHLFKFHHSNLIRMALLTCCFSVSSSILVVFMPNYLSSNNDFDPSTIFNITSSIFFIFILACPIAGYFSDKFGVSLISKIGSLSTLFMGVPLVVGLAYFSTPYYILLIMIIFLIPFSLTSASLFAVMVNTFPVNVRYTGVSLSYSISAAIFGGLTPLAINRIEIIIPAHLAAGAFVSLSGLISFLALYKHKSLSVINEERLIHEAI